MLNSNQARIRSFRVVPSLPAPLEPLLHIAQNLWWTWKPEAIALFVRLDPEGWSKYSHNPVKLLGNVSQARLERAAADESFLHEINRVYAALEQHRMRRGWFEQTHPEVQDAVIAYFSAEFGLSECFQIYSGGLGILAGDHLKSASELALPMVGVGLLYQHGYFMQYLNGDGWQQETYPDLDFANQPIERVRDRQDNWLKVKVALPGRDVYAGVWRAQVGRVPLFLLDTNQQENQPQDRQITRNLYGGDVEMRIQQEIILGIGGVRALTAMGINPSVCHINEGHAAFLALERIRVLIEKENMDFDEAKTLAASRHVFTTHTPVPAGIDRFHPNMVEHYFRDFAPSLRLDTEGLLSLGRENVFDKDEYFSMAVLAIRTSSGCNAVSKLHGEVSRSMWTNVWPGVPSNEIPIGHVTNGVHARSWLSRDMGQLFNRYLGYRWRHDPTDYSVWDRIDDIPDEELWAVISRRRHKLITWARRRIRQQRKAHGASAEQIEAAAAALHPDALTIGFARRFATYKRATLLLRDLDRFVSLLNDEDRPIQFLIAGKAHPADAAGKEFIRQIVHFSRDRSHGGRHNGRVVFLENYDMNVGRYLVTGCDVWLNTPRRGLEASGTSGMKAALNGGINCSILDGWWDEAYEPTLGFAIGGRAEFPNDEEADDVESRSLFDLFESHILPEFYERNASDVPHRWVTRIKETIKELAPFFNSNRMVQQYTEQFYIPAHQRGHALAADKSKEGRDLAHHIRRYRAHWQSVRVESVDAATNKPVQVNQPLSVTSVVHLGELESKEVSVELYTGQVSAAGDLLDGVAIPMTHAESLGDGRHRYVCELSIDQSGRRGFSVRVVPNDARMATPFIPGLVTWDQGSRAPASTGRVAPVSS